MPPIKRQRRTLLNKTAGLARPPKCSRRSACSQLKRPKGGPSGAPTGGPRGDLHSSLAVRPAATSAAATLPATTRTATSSGASTEQIGASLGHNFGLVVLRLTPYIGIHQSTFSKIFSDTTSYNVGIKLKPALIPLAVSLQYTYQNPDIVGTNTSFAMHNVQVLLGLHF